MRLLPLNQIMNIRFSNDKSAQFVFLVRSLIVVRNVNYWLDLQMTLREFYPFIESASVGDSLHWFRLLFSLAENQNIFRWYRV